MFLRVLNAASGPEAAWSFLAVFPPPCFGNVVSQTTVGAAINVPNLEVGDAVHVAPSGPGFAPPLAAATLTIGGTVFAAGVAALLIGNFGAVDVDTSLSTASLELLITRSRNLRNA